MRIDFNTQAGFDQYNGRVKTGINVEGQEIRLDHSYPVAERPILQRYVGYYIAMGLLPTHSYAILSWDDYGQSVEILKAMGYPNGIALSPSAYVQTLKGLDDTPDIEAELVLRGLTPVHPAWDAVVNKYSSRGPRARTTILNEDASTNRSRNAIKQAVGVTGQNLIDLMVIETHLEVFENAEAQSISSRAHQIAGRVAWLYADADQLRAWVVARGDLNRQNTAAWRALLPDDYLIRDSDGQVSVP
jgi:hypothetical protein